MRDWWDGGEDSGRWGTQRPQGLQNRVWGRGVLELRPERRSGEWTEFAESLVLVTRAIAQWKGIDLARGQPRLHPPNPRRSLEPARSDS